MLRISKTRRKNVTVVHVEGRLSGDGVEELERECTEAGAPLELDLSALLTADEVGLAVLRSLRNSGAALSGASRFLQLLIEGAPGTRPRGQRAG